MITTVLRNFQNKNDIEQIAKIHQDCKEADQIDEQSSLESVPTPEEIKDNLDDDHCNPETDIVITEVDDKVVGYTKVSWWNEANDIRLFLIQGLVIPEFRGKGIGKKQLEWAENRAKTIEESLPRSSNPMYGANASTTQPDRIKFLEENGYSLTFSMVEMENPNIEEVQVIALSDEFEIREVEDKDLRKIWEANNEVYQDRDFVTEIDEEDYQDFINDSSNDYSLWKVAWDGDYIAGFVISKIEKSRGEITQVSVLPKYRRKGLAQALLTLNLKELANKGIKTARLHTSGENVSGAQNLYQNAGFKILKRFNRYRKPVN